MLKKWLVLLLTTSFILVGCKSAVYNQTEANVADVKLKMTEDFRKSDSIKDPQAALVVKQGPYVDTTPINLSKRPSWLQNHIVIRGDQLPFSYYSRTIVNGTGHNILTKYQTGLDPAISVSLSYSGTVEGALDLLASKSGYVYTIRGNSVFWMALVTRTFDIAFMPGGTDYLMGKGSGGATSTQAAPSGAVTSNYTTSDSSDQEYSSLSGKLSIWTDLESTIKQLLTDRGSVVVSESTTSVTVRDKPAAVELVSQYVGNLNRNLSKQVLVKVQILEVTLENDYEFGIDWGIIANAFNKSPFVFNANYGTPVSITTFSGASLIPPQLGTQAAIQSNGKPGIPSYTILFNALNQQGKTSLVTEPRVICLNNQVSVIRIVDQNGYVASIQNTTTSGGGTNVNSNTVTSQVTPGNLITGLTLYILPKILNDNVYMQVNADLSANKGFTIIGGTVSGTLLASQVQLPNITEKHFNQRSMVKSGDTMILSGFRQTQNTANAMQFFKSQALGGKGSQQIQKETIILITPYILHGSV